MYFDCAWIFRICLVMIATMILYADFIGFGGASARINDQSEDYEDLTADDKVAKSKSDKDKISGKYVPTNNKMSIYPKDNNAGLLEDDDRIDLKLFRKSLTDKQRFEPTKKGFEFVNQRISDSLRELCLPKLLCEIAARPTYLLSDKEKHVLSLLKSTSLSIVAGSPSVYHFSSHMGQLMRHSADTMGGSIQGCSMLWPNCPYSSEKLMKISTKVRLR